MNKQIIQYWTTSTHMMVIERHKLICILVVAIWHMNKPRSMIVKVLKKVPKMATTIYAWMQFGQDIFITTIYLGKGKIFVSQTLHLKKIKC